MTRDTHRTLCNSLGVLLLLLLLAAVASPLACAQERSFPEAHELARLILSSGMFEAVIQTAGDAATTVVTVAIEGRLRRSLSADEQSTLRRLLIQTTKETVPWDVWEELYARLYSKHASPQEIRDILAFYKTPLGRRALSLSLILTTEGMEAGRGLAKSREKDFERRFTDEFGKTMPELKAELERSQAR
jgi:hypothetical protein